MGLSGMIDRPGCLLPENQLAAAHAARQNAGVGRTGMEPMQLRLVRYLIYVLAACVILSDASYLLYLDSGHHMLRYWSGTNSALLGLFMVSWAMPMRANGGRWAAWAAATIAVIGLFNLAAGLAFFL